MLEHGWAKAPIMILRMSTASAHAQPEHVLLAPTATVARQGTSRASNVFTKSCMQLPEERLRMTRPERVAVLHPGSGALARGSFSAYMVYVLLGKIGVQIEASAH